MSDHEQRMLAAGLAILITLGSLILSLTIKREVPIIGLALAYFIFRK